ncbi:Uncharacterised protein [Mycobacteroides abscessus subsp. abscessus]|nr:Uncharacterised protein [Mycobacteroides abscessus subsp. abscessus]
MICSIYGVGGAGVNWPTSGIGSPGSGGGMKFIRDMATFHCLTSFSPAGVFSSMPNCAGSTPRP